ncbi:VOC family protein [Amphibacillus sediminis]|uniref:VOC family protein n=1 Tax=Amphibacillus sediminis TaxID=360185 RepID=UPI000A704DD9|nr:VOC family protein [Amphibacillus sediminis]
MFHDSPATYISHITLKVSDLEQAKQFYQSVLGLTALTQTENKIIFTTDGKQELITLKYDPSYHQAKMKTTGLYHFALLLPSREDLARFLRHLVINDIPIGASDHLVSEAIYFNDPDGNGIEVYADRPPAQWHWQEEQVKMTVDPLKADELIKLGETLPQWDQIPVGTKLGHIHLHVDDLSKAEHFYVNGLGFNVVSRLGNQALFISTENYHHHIGLNTWNGVGAPPAEQNQVGLDQFSIHYPSTQVLEEVVNQLTRIGADVTRDNDQLWLLDPAQNKVKLHA